MDEQTFQTVDAFIRWAIAMAGLPGPTWISLKELFEPEVAEGLILGDGWAAPGFLVERDLILVVSSEAYGQHEIRLRLRSWSFDYPFGLMIWFPTSVELEPIVVELRRRRHID